jgi:hypothetical protein
VKVKARLAALGSRDHKRLTGGKARSGTCPVQLSGTLRGCSGTAAVWCEEMAARLSRSVGFLKGQCLQEAIAHRAIEDTYA